LHFLEFLLIFNTNVLLKTIYPPHFSLVASNCLFLQEHFATVPQIAKNEASPIIIAEFDITENIDFVLSKDGSISGLVTAEEDGRPLKRAHLIAHLVVNPKVRRRPFCGRWNLHH